MTGLEPHPMKFDLMKQRRADPLFEARRLAGLREAMKAPRPTAWRRNQREGILRALREGKMRLSPEKKAAAIAKTAAKLRGRKRPAWVVKKITMANRGKKRSPECIREMSARLKGKKRVWKSAEAYADFCESIRKAKAGKGIPRHVQERAWRSSRGRKWDQETVERRVAPMRGRPCTAPLVKKGPEHFLAMTGALRSPTNVIYPFRNLSHWVREHEHLFDPEDVIWKPSAKARPRALRCNASHGLGGLFGQHNNVRGSWKGWTRVSHYERLIMDNHDLLDRSAIAT